MVGIVLVSHSRTLAEGLLEMVAQVAGSEVRVAIAAGMPDGRLGTSAPLIVDAIRAVDGPEGVLVLLDLGSAVLSIELALEELEEDERGRVVVSDGPLVEGAVVAAVQASIGAGLAEVAAEAAAAARLTKSAGGAPV
ncbi:MAG: dihydroxyacetone kinase phosphoryl donor subunit DhaM [Chloroflexota bacterium]